MWDFQKCSTHKYFACIAPNYVCLTYPIPVCCPPCVNYTKDKQHLYVSFTLLTWSKRVCLFPIYLKKYYYQTFLHVFASCSLISFLRILCFFLGDDRWTSSQTRGGSRSDISWSKGRIALSGNLLFNAPGKCHFLLVSFNHVHRFDVIRERSESLSITFYTNFCLCCKHKIFKWTTSIVDNGTIDFIYSNYIFVPMLKLLWRIEAWLCVCFKLKLKYKYITILDIRSFFLFQPNFWESNVSVITSIWNLFWALMEDPHSSPGLREVAHLHFVMPEHLPTILSLKGINFVFMHLWLTRYVIT